MAGNKLQRTGPLAITNAAANLMNPPTLTGGVNVGGSNTYLIIRHIIVNNKTSSFATVSLYIGATGASAAGTEFWATARTVPPNTAIEYFGAVTLEAADFLVGLANASTTLTFEAEYEIGIR